MKWLRRIAGVALILVSIAVFAGCVAGVVGVWRLKRDVDGRVETASGQIDDGLQRAAGATRTFHRSLETIRADVKLVREDHDELEPGTERNRLVSGYFRTVTQRIRLFAETVTGITGLLRNIPEVPFAPGARPDPAKLDRASIGAAELATAAGTIQARLGGDEKPVKVQDLVDSAEELEAALQKCDAVLTEYENDLRSARDELPGRKAEVLRWTHLGVVATTCVGVWFALSQVCLFLRGWRWCRGS